MAEERHSTNDLWQRINDQSSQIGEIRSGQAATDARLGALESAVDTGFRSISQELHVIAQRVNAPPEPPNHLPLIMLSLGLLGMFGGYALLITAPMRENIEQNYEQTTKHSEYASDIAAIKERAEIMYDDISALKEWRNESNRHHGRVDELIRRVEDIDNYGSRRWNTDDR